MNDVSKKYDITVYGATGFTGTLAARALSEHCQTLGLRLALAGRNQQKLESLAAQLPGRPPVLVADSADRAALDRLTAETRVVASLAGPFARYAPLLIASCVDHQCDYVDITGEAPFIREMIDRHHERASRNGVRIVPFCGFDSIPSDLGFYFLLREWRKRYAAAGEACSHVVALFQGQGGLNGGTALSAIQMAREGKTRLLDRDLTLLCDDTLPRPPASPDWKGPRRFRELDCYGAPFFMAPINTRVVRRSQALFSREETSQTFSPSLQVSYEEGMLMKERVPVRSALLSGAMFTVNLLSRSQGVLALAERLAPAPGTGPSEKVMASGFAKVTYLATGARGSTLRAKFFAHGDAGNRATITMLSQAALCLAIPSERARLPPVSGVLTPAFAFRDVLVNRLIASGVTLELASATGP